MEFKKIKKIIKKAIAQKVYNFSVPGLENYIANNHIVHNCYVKAHEDGEDGFHTPWQQQVDLFRYFYIGPGWANQITISVDDLHKDPDKRDHMLNLIKGIFAVMEADQRPTDKRPEVHMTMHTPRTFFQYLYADTGRKYKTWRKLGMVSFSELPEGIKETKEVIDYFRELKVPINYNKLMPTYNNGMDWDKEAARLTNLLTKIDHIYLVIYKRPIGLAKKDVISPADTERMTSDIVYLENILSRVPEDAKAKITTDGCLRDTIQASRTGFGCSSGVSRFQVWPDGTVSGCPYAFRGMGKRAGIHQDILANIREARKFYEFRETCHLPTVYSSTPGLRIVEQARA